MNNEYYLNKALDFFAKTATLDLRPIYNELELREGQSIIDAGCGSGRDAKFFSGMGMEVFAFDASPELAKLATKFSGIDVETKTFLEYTAPKKVDHIWCMASLLHVPYIELPRTIDHLLSQLNEGGDMYCSFKYSELPEFDDENGRVFTGMTLSRLETIIELMESKPAFIKIWYDQSMNDVTWVNIIFKV